MSPNCYSRLFYPLWTPSHPVLQPHQLTLFRLHPQRSEHLPMLCPRLEDSSFFAQRVPTYPFWPSSPIRLSLGLLTSSPRPKTAVPARQEQRHYAM